MFFKTERLTMCPTERRFLAVHDVRTHLKVKIYLTLDVNEMVTNGLTFWHRCFTFNSNKSPT
jgi:hypothetical protein